MRDPRALMPVSRGRVAFHPFARSRAARYRALTRLTVDVSIYGLMHALGVNPHSSLKPGERGVHRARGVIRPWCPLRDLLTIARGSGRRIERAGIRTGSRLGAAQSATVGGAYVRRPLTHSSPALSTRSHVRFSRAPLALGHAHSPRQRRSRLTPRCSGLAYAGLCAPTPAEIPIAPLQRKSNALSLGGNTPHVQPVCRVRTSGRTASAETFRRRSRDPDRRRH